MSYYHQRRELAQAAGDQRFAADWHVTTQFEPDNGWVVVLRPRNGVSTIRAANLDDILNHAEIQCDLRRKPDTKIVYRPPARPISGSATGSVGGGSITLRLKAIWERLDIQSRDDRARFVEAAIADGVNRNSAGAFWAKYAREQKL